MCFVRAGGRRLLFQRQCFQPVYASHPPSLQAVKAFACSKAGWLLRLQNELSPFACASQLSPTPFEITTKPLLVGLKALQEASS